MDLQLIFPRPTSAESITPGNREPVSHEELKKEIEEADLRIIPHISHSVRSGCQRVVVLSNDTDILVLLIHFFSFFHGCGLQELWMRKSAKEIIPIHSLAMKIGSVSEVILASHYLTGSDVTSKIGTKSAALKAHPENFLRNFGREENGNETDYALAEKFLVQVLKHGSACNTFDELRYYTHTGTKNTNLLKLPPTTSALRAHLRRAHFVVYTSASVLSTDKLLNPLEYGWIFRRR